MRKFTKAVIASPFATIALTAVAFAGDGGEDVSSLAFIAQAVGRLATKLLGFL